MCIAGSVVASANLASTPIGTGTARRGFAVLGTAGLARSRSSPAHVGFLHLQTKGQTWKAESLRVALAGNGQRHLHPACLVGSGGLAH